jgi:putative endopeptidase
MKLKMTMMALSLMASAAGAQNSSSGIDKANLDTSVKPGTDFYRYAAAVGWRLILWMPSIP